MTNLIIILGLFSFLFNDKEIDINHDYLDNQLQISVEHFESEYKEHQEYLKEQEYIKKHSYKGETEDEIAKKIDRYLNSTMKGKGKFIAAYSIEKGVDPYLSASVILLETGCRWTCSRLTQKCNNVGGNKGKPSCNGGSYRRFDTLEDGIKFAINNLSGYIKKGLTTPEQINKKYAESKTWAKKVNNYMKLLKK